MAKGRFAGLASAALVRLRASAIKFVRRPRLHLLAEIADRKGWTKTYDAEYIAPAQYSKCLLLTLDAKLARAAQDLVEIASPPICNQAGQGV